MILLGVLGVMILIFLPGAWLTFGLRLPDLSCGPKLLIGAALSPLVICAQFYALRLLGVSYNTSAILLPLVNLPALILIFRELRLHRTVLLHIDWHVLAGALVVLSILLIAISPQLIYPATRQLTGHAWYYSAPMYEIANGGLMLQDPDLAGMRLAYPWGGVVYQAILSYLLASPPVVSFIWTNLIWLLLIYALLIWIVKELGGGRFAQVSALIWLSLGVNFTGFMLEKLSSFFGWHFPSILGDSRYTPWVIKFLFLQQEPLTLGIFSAVLFLMVKKWSGRLPAAVHWILVFLICEIALILPVYAPAAGALLGAKIITLLYDRFKEKKKPISRDVIWLAVDLLIAGIITVIYVRFITRDRVTDSVGFFGPANLEGVKLLILRTSACLVALSLLLIGWMAVVRNLWKAQRQATIVLTLGAIASCTLAILFHIPGFTNEYKYIFTAAICLAPFPSLALEPLASRGKRLAFPIYILLTIILAIPLAYRMIHEWPWWPESGLVSPPPKTDLGHFDLQLQADEPYAGMVEAIRDKTPGNSILVVQDASQYLPILAQRAMYITPGQKQSYAGVNVPTRFMLLEAKGYDPQIVDARWLDIKQLFQSQEAGQIESSIQRMLSLKSPLTIILQAERDTGLHDWLRTHQAWQVIYEGGGFIVWLIKPEA